MAINATVDGVTYSGIDTINTGGKVIGLTASFPGAISADDIAMNTLTEATGSIATYIGDYAFAYNNSLSVVSFPNVVSIGSYAFTSAGVESVFLPSAETCGAYGFANCMKLQSIELAELRSISAYGHAFGNIAALKSVNLPKLNVLPQHDFASCVNLETVSAPMLTGIGESAFWNCKKLASVEFPVCTITRGAAFSNCNALSSVDMPLLQAIDSACFYNCSALESVNFPSASYIGGNGGAGGKAFQSCINLSIASFGGSGNLSRIYGTANFGSCYNLLSLYIMADSVPTLQYSNNFSSSPIGGYTAQTGGVLGSIYVPASLLTAYQSATNWVFFSERLVGI